MYLTRKEIAVLIGPEFMGSAYIIKRRIDKLNETGANIRYFERKNLFGYLFGIEVYDHAVGTL